MKSDPTDKLALLRQQLTNMNQMAELLRLSVNRCRACPLPDDKSLTPEQLERFESLTARYARFNDVLLQKIFRLIDELDLDSTGTVRDRINRAEKKGLINNARQFIEYRELRNSIAHEYQQDVVYDLFRHVLESAPVLLTIPVKVHTYCERY